MSEVDDAESVLHIDAYSDFTSDHKPTVFITVGDLLGLHEVLIENVEAIAHGRQHVRTLMLDAGSKVPTVKDLVGDHPDGANMHLTLVLSPKRTLVVDSALDEKQKLFLTYV